MSRDDLQALHNGAKGGLEQATDQEAARGRCGSRRRRPHERTPRFIAPVLLIDHRAATVEERRARATGRVT